MSYFLQDGKEILRKTLLMFLNVRPLRVLYSLLGYLGCFCESFEFTGKAFSLVGTEIPRLSLSYD